MLRPDSFARLCRARDMLREVHDRPWTIDEVARAAAMSPFHFIRQFTALFGETPHQFRIRARLESARYLLAVERRSVTRVCVDVGCSSLGSFSDLFARRVGDAALRVPAPRTRHGHRARDDTAGTVPRLSQPLGAAFATFEKR
jgi:AraC-like DNA-binding protein